MEQTGHDVRGAPPVTLLRWTFILATAFLMSVVGGPSSFLSAGGFALGLLCASNALMTGFDLSPLRWRRRTATLLAIDAALAAIILGSCGESAVVLLALLTGTVALIAAAEAPSRLVVTGSVLGAVAWSASLSGDTPWLRELPGGLATMGFAATSALYGGSVALASRRRWREEARVELENRELRTLLEILETVTSSLDLHRVMRSIVAKVGEVVDVDRASLLLLDRAPDLGWVMASSESSQVDMLPIDLRKYPEVQRAISTNAPVIVDDIDTNPMMSPVRDELRRAGVNSLLVIPLIFQEEILGALLIRAARRRQIFTSEEIRFCQLVGSASVSALKNGMLYREMRLESEQHRSTSEKLGRILENSMDVILTVGPDGRITEFNPSAESVLGWSRDEVVGRPVSELIPEADGHGDLLARLRRSGTVVEEGRSLVSGDGSPVPLDLTITTVRNDLGEMVGAVCMGKDPNRLH